MATYKNINKSTNVVSVGRTAPVPRGVQSKNNSLPVVLASDADPIPVVEQNKILSEVALSLLGIPRSEVALGIFADVNTYDVNPSEWSIKPIDRTNFTKSTFARPFDYSQDTNTVTFQHGLTHIPEEAGALVEAPPNETATLTSKRFFRYQPGRVSAATFGVKESIVEESQVANGPSKLNRNPAIRKFGIYDKFDGYYWETRDTGKGDQFGVTRRTQSIIDFRDAKSEFSTAANKQTEDYGIVGKGNSTELECVMTKNSAHSSPNLSTLVFPQADINAAPEVGMTVKNITIMPDGTAENTDTFPAFSENTVVTSVIEVANHESGDGVASYEVTLNQPTITNAVTSRTGGTDNDGNVSGTFGKKQHGYKRLKFTRAGELAIVRDGLLMTQSSIYDPSQLKDPVLNEIAAVTGEDIKFNSPAGGASNSPGGLRVNEVFEFGQLVQYTTDGAAATTEAGSAGQSIIHGDSPSIFMIREINVNKNSIKLRQIPSMFNSDGTTTTNESPANLNLKMPGKICNTAAGSFSTTKHFIKTPVPFIFPEIFTTSTQNVYDIAFPYARSFTVDRTTISGTDHKGDSKAGLIDTDLVGTGTGLSSTKFDSYKQAISDLNRGLTACTMRSGTAAGTNQQLSAAKLTSGWRYWIQQNCKSDYFGVYEYKIPRSRFSHDSLDSDEDAEVFYSDITKVSGNVKYPGQAVTGDGSQRTSLWDIDFSKVIMKKIEFSWYGAVGALFLAYVPVGNGEARWIRVHHLRASNQLKVASLGNATLPLTYTIFGGGTPKMLGNTGFRSSAYAGGKSVSEFITKYGSSYYIDGGDRGTVRLFNFAPPAPTRVGSSTMPLKLNTTMGATGDRFTFSYSPASVNATSLGGKAIGNNVRGPTDILIGGTITSSNGASTAKIDWVERQGDVRDGLNNTPFTGTVYLNRQFTNSTSGGMHPGVSRVVIEPGTNLYGLESKTEILSSQDFAVRNRVQVYPTKLSAGMSTKNGQKEPVALTLKKNVLYQTDQVHKLAVNPAPPGNAVVRKGAQRHEDVFRFEGTSANLTLNAAGLPTRLTSNNSSPINDCPSIPVGTEFFGHARVSDALDNDFTLFSKIKKTSLDATGKGVFDFIPLEAYSGTVKFKNASTFTHSLQYNNAGEILSAAIVQDKEEIERLSSIRVDNQIRRSIPGTGTRVAEFFLEDGSDYYDLQAYFDYNKDYISFPLTDEPDNLYIEAKINSPGFKPGDSPSVAVSLTWEEQ
jgi:hypothetical protein